MSDIGSRIKAFREARGLTQEELADKLGMKKQTISNYENGRRKPSVKLTNDIADALSIPVVRLVAAPREVNLYSGPGAICINTPPLFPTDEPPLPPDAIPASEMQMIPVIGCVRGGLGTSAIEEYLGKEPAFVQGPAEDYFYLKVVGDSMSPAINEGDLALVRRNMTPEDRQLVVAIIKGEFNDEGVIKQYREYPSAFALVSFNPEHEPIFFHGKEKNRVIIVGKVVQTVHKWD